MEHNPDTIKTQVINMSSIVIYIDFIKQPLF